MGGRKFRLGTHRRNEERKRRQKKAEERQTSLEDSSSPAETLTVSLPMSVYLEGTVSNVSHLSSRLLSGHCVPSTWILARQIPLLLCKLSTHDNAASLSISLSIQHDFCWTITMGSQVLTSTLCPLLVGRPDRLVSASAVREVLSTVDDSKHCTGNTEPRFVEQWKQRSLTLHGLSGMLLHMWKNNILSLCCVLRGTNCPHQHSSDGSTEPTTLSLPVVSGKWFQSCSVWPLYNSAWHYTCSGCAADEGSFWSNARQSSVIVYTYMCEGAFYTYMFISFRYKPLPDLVSRVKEVHHQYRLLSRQHDRLRGKIAAAADKANIVVDEETHHDLVAITEDSVNFLDDLPPDSFQRIFWQQQVEAAAQKDSRAMRWHPLMVRWCLYLRHRLVTLSVYTV